jgi:hypothetical protein
MKMGLRGLGVKLSGSSLIHPPRSVVPRMRPAVEAALEAALRALIEAAKV